MKGSAIMRDSRECSAQTVHDRHGELGSVTGHDIGDIAQQFGATYCEDTRTYTFPDTSRIDVTDPDQPTVHTPADAR